MRFCLHALRAPLRSLNDFHDVDGLRCVSADGRPIPLHVDGDVTEAVFGVMPGALTVVS